MTNNIKEIIDELNENNSSNYKLDVLKKYQDNTLLKRVLKMTYDKVSYDYGIGRKTLDKVNSMTMVWDYNKQLTLEECLDILENDFATRKVTGNNAIDSLYSMFIQSNMDNIDIVSKVILRDLRINLGTKQIKKVFKDLIDKPAYMRCDVLTKKTAKNISYPAILEKKSDGTYREFAVSDGEVNTRSRSGESYDYPVLNQYLSKLPDNIYPGELTVRASENTMKTIYEKLDVAKRKGEDTEELESIIEKYNDSVKNEYEYILPRSIGNGLINSDEPPHNDIVLELWDCISFEEYTNAKRKIKNKMNYKERWNNLVNALQLISYKDIRLIENVEVNSHEDVMLQNKIWMEIGYEGSILKDWSGVFEDTTSKKQLKIKLKISVEMRILGFQDGTPGTKREGKVGSVIFGNDEGTIKGRCSGFTDDDLEEFTKNKEYYLNKIAEVEFNDLSRASGNSYYALSHPRFIEVRYDKTETDTLEKAFELREMAMDISQYFS